MASSKQNTIIKKKMLVKMVLLGDPGAGKTSFMNRFVIDRFYLGYRNTIGADFLTKDIQVSDGTLIKLQLWDTSGIERFQSYSPALFRGADNFVVLFDTSNRLSFKNVLKHLEVLSPFQSQFTRTCIIGTKIDLTNKREVSYEEAFELANHLGAKFFEVSSKDNINVKEAVEAMVEEVSKLPRVELDSLVLNIPIAIVFKPSHPCVC